MVTRGFTATALAAAVAEVLEDSGYRLATRQNEQDWAEWPAPGAKVYEDAYSVVALVVYETWADLSDGWLTAQEALVELISAYFKRGEPKTWEGYLLLFTPSVVPATARAEAVAIQRNTAHVRKILGTGDLLRGLHDVRNALLPLLPLEAFESIGQPRAALDILPDILRRDGIPEEAARATIKALLNEEPIIERLHAQMDDSGPEPP